MKMASWMIGASIASWLAIAALVGMSTAVEVLWGMIGPLVVATGSWMLIERTYRRNPAGLTAVMIKAFAGKFMFFGAYVAIVLRGRSGHPVPFVASFTGYFIALHLIEALGLRRLFMDAPRLDSL
jgi:hypothetical protein